MTFELQVDSIKYGERIPDKYTCKGENVSPEIKWKDAPSSSKELVLFLDDPDAPRGNFVHWVITGISPSAGSLHENVEKSEKTPEGWIQLKNDFGKIGYDGPCPPGSQVHNYVFTLYALVSPLTDDDRKERGQLRKLCEMRMVKKVTWIFPYGRK
ncbi:YbhB/YbcL family Raf kinase inhibitor-like protein [Cuniculiplasma sp. SKW3]|uniref:YbhB/YbcL family Raf kinase inhibitor-like protein n=1 Tax=Cuniculiplasma sp. SKW3 TaxID=3400170 RepID=UPI003FD356D6